MTGEVFTNAPLQLVAFEIVATLPQGRADTELISIVSSAIGDPGARLELAPTIVRQGRNGTDIEGALFRIIGLNSTVAVTIWRTAVVVEHTNYLHFADFFEFLKGIMTALYETSETYSVTRLGLRYVDEVHIDGPADTLSNWEGYLNPALLWPLQYVGRDVQRVANACSVTIAEHKIVNVRSALLPGRALQPDQGPLELRPRPDTPSFLLDCDGVYEPSSPAPKLEVKEIFEIITELHIATDEIFQKTFTEVTRKDVFRKGRE